MQQTYSCVMLAAPPHMIEKPEKKSQAIARRFFLPYISLNLEKQTAKPVCDERNGIHERLSSHMPPPFLAGKERVFGTYSCMSGGIPG